jgi:hypothetical protein
MFGRFPVQKRTESEKVDISGDSAGSLGPVRAAGLRSGLLVSSGEDLMHRIKGVRNSRSVGL